MHRCAIVLRPRLSGSTILGVVGCAEDEEGHCVYTNQSLISIALSRQYDKLVDIIIVYFN